jgi:RNA polymerase sigma-70 factor (sigma-E family)
MERTSSGHSSYSSYVDARWSALYRFAYLLTTDRDQADDLLQATMIKVYLKWDHVIAASSVDAYVRRMLINELLGEHRRSARRRDRQRLLVPVEEAATDDPVDRVDLWQHLGALPPRQRAVLVLRYYEDQTEAQIAALLGCSRGTVKSQAHDGLRTLRRRLGTDEEVSR